MEGHGAYDEVKLEHERLEVYGLALRLHAASCALVPRRELRTLRDQLERASLGVVLNIAEGAGRTSGPDKGASTRWLEEARPRAPRSSMCSGSAPSPLLTHAPKHAPWPFASSKSSASSPARPEIPSQPNRGRRRARPRDRSGVTVAVAVAVTVAAL